jgi:hypothetical protein
MGIVWAIVAGTVLILIVLAVALGGMYTHMREDRDRERTEANSARASRLTTLATLEKTEEQLHAAEQQLRNAEDERNFVQARLVWMDGQLQQINASAFNASEGMRSALSIANAYQTISAEIRQLGKIIRAPSQARHSLPQRPEYENPYPLPGRPPALAQGPHRVRHFHVDHGGPVLEAEEVPGTGADAARDEGGWGLHTATSAAGQNAQPAAPVYDTNTMTFNPDPGQYWPESRAVND